MKHLLLCLLALASLLAAPARLRAQAVDSLHLKLDYLLAPLDKSQVPTPFLADYGHAHVPLPYFDGTLRDSTRTNATLWRALYASVYSACLSATNPLPTLPAVNQRVRAAEANGPTLIPLLVERLDYARLRPDALAAGLLSYSAGQLHDVPGRAESPYEQRTLFAAAPSFERAPSGNVSFVFTRPLHLQSGGGTVRTLSLDLGDGQGYRPAAWNVPVAASYPAAGTYRLKVRVTYNGTFSETNELAALPVSYESQFDLYVAAPAAPAARTLADVEIPFSAQPGQPGRAAGTAYIHYATGHTTLVKPLIVVEGYDKSHVAPHLQENYTLKDFLRETTTGQNGGFDFRQALEDVGQYDIVFIDYYDGTDDILRNANLFKAVLDEVNTRKDPASTEDNVVLGMSMGGLIARYKLAEMEQASPGSTHTRLLVLQDSPQRGANIPLGLSALIRQLQLSLGTYTTGDADVLLQEANALLDAPATKQLLLYQTVLTPRQLAGNITTHTIDYSGNTFLDGTYRPMINYAAPYRIVAVSEGSQCGVGLFQPYTELIRAQGLLPIFNLPFVFAGSGSLAGEVVVNAIPANGASARVSGLHLLQQTQLFFGLITVQVNLVDDNFLCPSGLLPLDGAPGGTEPIGDLVGAKDILLGISFGGRSLFLTAALVPTFSFLPTASGLDVEDFNVVTLTGTYINGITTASRSRTNGFLAQEQIGTRYNQPHLTYTARNGEWIYNEMQRPYNGNQNPLACNATGCDPYAGKQITGPMTLCVPGSSPATYTSPAQGPGYTYQWSVDDCSKVTVCTGTSPIFQTANVPGQNSNVVLTLLVTTPCTTYTFTRPLAVGVPALEVVLDERDDCRRIAYYHIENYEPSISYYRNGTTAIGSTFWVKTANFTVTATNSCGSTTVAGTTDFQPCTAPNDYTVYPNPASDEVTVAQADTSSAQTQRGGALLANASNATGSGGGFTVQVYDSYGTLRHTAGTSTGQVQLNTSSLPAGLYILVITEADTGAVVRRQLEVVR